jgi:hypothetical protein
MIHMTTTTILTVIGRWTQMNFAILRTKIPTFLCLLLPTLDPMPLSSKLA